MIIASMVSRGRAVSPLRPINVSPSRLVRQLSPTFRDVVNLQPGECAIKKPLYIEESGKTSSTSEETFNLILEKLSKMEIKYDQQVKKLEEDNRQLGVRVEELEEEQIALFLRHVTDKWLSAVGKQKLLRFSTIEDLKKTIRDIIFLREKIRMGKGSQGIQYKLKAVESKLVSWRKAVNDEKVLGVFEIGEASGARQFELLLTSYMEVNEKAHSSMVSARWATMEVKVLQKVEAGKLKIEGVSVGSMVKNMLKDLKGGPLVA